MEELEFDKFKKEIKDWMETHPKEYTSFVKKPYKMLKKIAKYSQKYPDFINQFTFENFTSSGNYTLRPEDVKQLYEDFHNPEYQDIVPPMLAYLYYGNFSVSIIKFIKNTFFEESSIIVKCLRYLHNLRHSSWGDEERAKEVAADAIEYEMEGSVQAGLTSKGELDKAFRKEQAIRNNTVEIYVLDSWDKQNNEKNQNDIVQEFSESIPSGDNLLLLQNEKEKQEKGYHKGVRNLMDEQVTRAFGGKEQFVGKLRDFLYNSPRDSNTMAFLLRAICRISNTQIEVTVFHRGIVELFSDLDFVGVRAIQRKYSELCSVVPKKGIYFYQTEENEEEIQRIINQLM